VPINIPSFSVYPVATWGLRTKVMPVDSRSVMTGLYYSDPTLALNSAHGIDFSIRSSAGIFVIEELAYLFHQGQGSTGLPGNYKLGAYVDSNGYQDPWLPKFHLNGASLLTSIGPFDVQAWERRKVLGVQRGQDEMVRECCGADEAIQHAHPVTQMEAFKPCQSRAGCLLGEVEEPIVAHLPGHRALLPSIAAPRQPFKVRNY
jgi:Carbohydrate-selective porin, OprB family